MAIEAIQMTLLILARIPGSVNFRGRYNEALHTEYYSHRTTISEISPLQQAEAEFLILLHNEMLPGYM
jgi:hypothetical protein